MSDSGTVFEALAAWATATPEAVVMIAPEREPVTYRQLHLAVERFADELRARGLGRHDRIALLLPDGPDLGIALLGAVAAGIAVPLPWPVPETEMLQALTTVRVRAVVASGDALSVTLAAAAADRGCPIIVHAADPSGRVGDFRLHGDRLGRPAPSTRPGPDDIAVVLRSSGTTGRPKLVPRLHRNVISTCRINVETKALMPGDRSMGLARTTYSQGLNLLMTTVFAGASMLCVSGPDSAAMSRWLEQYRPTYISTTPAVLRVLVANGALRKALKASPPRCILASAGPLSGAEALRLESELDVPILRSYGMSEASAIAGESYGEHDRVPGAVGRPWCDVRITDERGVVLGESQSGEVVVRGPRVFPGYLDDPAASAAAFLPGGWFRTRDLGFLDDAGYLHLTGRLGEVINRGGEMIAPAEVDDALRAHPAVAEAAAFAVPDPLLGEDVVAAVMPKLGWSVTPLELRTWMLDRMAPHKVPRRIWFVDDLPRTATGKVQRGELARRWREAHR